MSDYRQIDLDIDKERLAKEGLTVNQLFGTLSNILGHDISVRAIQYDSGQERIFLRSAQSQKYDVWGAMNIPISIGNRTLKLVNFATMTMHKLPQTISKENQQYRLCLQYEYIGSPTQGKKLMETEIEEINRELPLGYSAASEELSWQDKRENINWLLLLVIAIIFFTTSILFNSITQPLAIIFNIPISFIGVFLIFYLTKINFDQGGFASFILLCGITVNASIYILNEFNSLRKKFPYREPLRLYLTAWNTKIFPIFLTVISTILGFIPFLIGEGKESFWFPLAIGTIGGLIMSVFGIFVYLPIFTLRIPALCRSK